MTCVAVCLLAVPVIAVIGAVVVDVECEMLKV